MTTRFYQKVEHREDMENESLHKIIGAAIGVHKVLEGPRLLEGVYESCLCHELLLRGFKTLFAPLRHFRALMQLSLSSSSFSIKKSF